MSTVHECLSVIGETAFMSTVHEWLSVRGKRDLCLQYMNDYQ